ncbi:AGAP010820-PA-like protein [Anopheles sinensis]|uniref:AGAP010820-PA-like protein n=1 Tax=Anopheles sinensis TaxID=74873 RepID=A0A084W649_ANOSI|nr:AGAP010820-PA-like protein [Anopheles sinensis]
MDGWIKCLLAVALALVSSQLPPVGSNVTETRPKTGGRDRSSSAPIASLSSASIAAALASRHANANAGGGSSAGNGNGSGGHAAGSGGLGKCNIAQLRCANGTCIPSSKFCDGNFDCLDRSDEPKSCTVRGGGVYVGFQISSADDIGEL